MDLTERVAGLRVGMLTVQRMVLLRPPTVLATCDCGAPWVWVTIEGLMSRRVDSCLVCRYMKDRPQLDRDILERMATARNEPRPDWDEVTDEDLSTMSYDRWRRARLKTDGRLVGSDAWLSRYERMRLRQEAKEVVDRARGEAA